MQEVFRAIGRLSRSSVSVLINGQSGTGKELVAHALHKHSPRKEQTFVALNMAAIPKDLPNKESDVLAASPILTATLPHTASASFCNF